VRVVRYLPHQRMAQDGEIFRLARIYRVVDTHVLMTVHQVVRTPLQPRQPHKRLQVAIRPVEILDSPREIYALQEGISHGRMAGVPVSQVVLMRKSFQSYLQVVAAAFVEMHEDSGRRLLSRGRVHIGRI